MTKYIAVVDETGTNNRPQDDEDSGFGVGAVIFPADTGARLADASKAIAQALGQADFKYRHVQKNRSARSIFLDALNGSAGQIYLYAFYVPGACIARERERTAKAAKLYGSQYTPSDSSNGIGAALLDTYVGYMAANIAAHASTNRYAIDVYWDRRTDLPQIAESFQQSVLAQSKTRRYQGVNDRVVFRGQATGELSHVTRLAGVLAGDIWKFFAAYGSRFWHNFDDAGLIGRLDPHMHVDDPTNSGPICIENVRQRLCSHIPDEPSVDTVMIQGYYKRFLRSERNEHLISFGVPSGVLGILGIVNGSHFKVYQLPD
jgi:hypothetical protein